MTDRSENSKVASDEGTSASASEVDAEVHGDDSATEGDIAKARPDGGDSGSDEARQSEDSAAPDDSATAALQSHDEEIVIEESFEIGDDIFDEEDDIFEEDEVMFDETDGDTDDHDIVIEDEEELFATDVIIDEDEVVIEEEFDQPTDEHLVVGEDEMGALFERGAGEVTSEHAIIEDELEFDEEDEVIFSDEEDLPDEEMIDFQEAPTGQTLVDRSATQEVATLEKNVFEEDEQDEQPYQDATVEISESELFGSSSFSEAQRAAAEERQRRFDEVGDRPVTGNDAAVPHHTPAAAKTFSGSHPTAAGSRRHTSDLSGSHDAAMSSPHAELDKQLRWLLALLVIALIAALVTLAVLLGAFDGNNAGADAEGSASAEQVHALVDASRDGFSGESIS